ncbi:hypothetical protein MANES_03G029200v8 [Manihot esculenta]|uniref:Uncharacterized protein n=1 Tax=Manihot esculenta TaxID=3983 RepID=A0A2C9W473_MANES|nr:hypothetical protein MANES_03G029200v8 [Manihot esculenta]
MSRDCYVLHVPRCNCNIEADLRTPWSGRNSSRRFYGCRNYKR